jgi:hypothetical protein
MSFLKIIRRRILIDKWRSLLCRAGSGADRWSMPTAMPTGLQQLHRRRRPRSRSADLVRGTPRAGTAGRDLGTEIEILSGLDLPDQVIDNPPDSLNTGDVVRVAGETANDGKSARLVSGKRVGGTSE